MILPRYRLIAVALGDAVALVSARPRHPARLLSHLRSPRTWLDSAGADAAVAELALTALWLLSGWVAFALLVTAARALPGRWGAGSDRLARRVLPRAVYRLAAGLVGLGVLAAPVVPATASTTGGLSTRASHGPIAAATATGPVVPSWPIDPTLPPPDPPTTAPATSTPPATTPPTTAPAASTPPTTVLVRPGDSLWTIAARHLGPTADSGRIATAWPRWWAANRGRIGGDPDLLRPGQLLQVPPDNPR